MRFFSSSSYFYSSPFFFYNRWAKTNPSICKLQHLHSRSANAFPTRNIPSLAIANPLLHHKHQKLKKQINSSTHFNPSPITDTTGIPKEKQKQMNPITHFNPLPVTDTIGMPKDKQKQMNSSTHFNTSPVTDIAGISKEKQKKMNPLTHFNPLPVIGIPKEKQKQMNPATHFNAPPITDTRGMPKEKQKKMNSETHFNAPPTTNTRGMPKEKQKQVNSETHFNSPPTTDSRGMTKEKQKQVNTATHFNSPPITDSRGMPKEKQKQVNSKTHFNAPPTTNTRGISKEKQKQINPETHFSPSLITHNKGTYLSKKQTEVLSAVAQGRSVFITGSAGTGKTLLLKHLIEFLQGIHGDKHVFVTASTGVAACALSGQTVHSFAGIGLGTGDRDSLLEKVAKNKLATKRWKKAKALVIDEVSMINGELFDRLEFIARMLRTRHSRDEVWGGIQLIVSGDFFQLPPINSPNPDKEFAFEADCWSTSFDLQVELTHVFRQSDAQMVELLQGIRKGRADLNYLGLLNGCFAKPELGESGEWDSSVTRLYPRNEDVKRVNDGRLKSLGGEIITYRAVDDGKEPWKRQLKQGIAPEELELCLGARVMLIKNIDPELGLVNGATGTVTGFVESKTSVICSISNRQMLPRVRFDSKLEMVVEPHSWDVIEGEMMMATRTQVPLILAWALSIHKCQGMTLDRLHTDLSRAFGCGMVYVALSRVRSLDGLYLSGFSPQKIKAHPKVLQYSQQAFSD